jgi:hypothetical protein
MYITHRDDAPKFAISAATAQKQSSFFINFMKNEFIVSVVLAPFEKKISIKFLWIFFE